MPTISRSLSDDELNTVQGSIIQNVRNAMSQEAMATTPEPGEIAETIIASFYKKQTDEERKWYQQIPDPSASGYIKERFAQQRLEEMLKHVWFLLLEQKAKDGGFDDPSN